MSPIHHVFGAGIADVVFGLDGYSDLPSITWNVTKLLKAAATGLFGPPVEKLLSDLPPMTDENRANIDWVKVNSLIASGDESVLDLPIINVLFEHKGVLHSMIVDGNHRLAARILMGLETFTRYEVPPDLERNYRVTFI